MVRDHLADLLGVAGVRVALRRCILVGLRLCCVGRSCLVLPAPLGPLMVRCHALVVGDSLGFLALGSLLVSLRLRGLELDPELLALGLVVARLLRGFLALLVRAPRPKLRLTFCSGAGTVTGANFLLEGNDKKFLIDCGLIQGEKLADTFLNA